MKAVAYCRISDDRLRTALGVARQEAECRRLAEHQGWEVAEVIVDNDKSAYSGKKRPGYERLMEGLKAGEWQAVIAWHPDRLHRAPKELESFIDVLDATGAKVLTVQAGHWDLTTSSGRLVARVLGAVARSESELKSERARSKALELFEAGKSAGGDRCFGYDGYTVVEHEAELIRSAAAGLLAGRSLRSICVEWNDAGVTTSLGNHWVPHVLRRLVMSAHVAGRREKDGRVVEAVWPPILPWSDVQRLRALLTDPARRRNLRSRSYLLTGGIAICGICGARLHARPKQGGAKAYRCIKGPGFDGCGGIGALAEPLESDAEARLLARLRRTKVHRQPPDVAPLLAALEADEASMAELATDFYADRSIDRLQFSAASARLTEKISATRAALARAEAERIALPGMQPAEAAVLYSSLGPAEKRAVWNLYVEAVIVGPAVRGRNTYDRRRVKMLWR